MGKLSDQVKIRGTVTRNRIAIPPMVCFYSPNEDGGVLDRSVEHYTNLAKGGAGLIIQEATCVSQDGKLAPMQIGIWKDEQVKNLRRITDAVHAEGCPIFVQLHHAGFKSVNGAPISASAYVWEDRRRGTSVTAQEMTMDDIRRIQDDFVQAARRAAEAGYDGMEFHGCHEYLISQILCAEVNKRTDIYGKEPWRFVSEMLERMREVVPESFALGVRIAGAEPTLEWGMNNIVSLQDYVDFFDVSAGFIRPETFEPMPKDYPFNLFVWLAHEARKRVRADIPVFAVNSIDYPKLAQDILDYTGVDMVDVGRSALVDCQWPNKALRGEEPGHCLHCARCGWMTGNCAGHKKFGTNG